MLLKYECSGFQFMYLIIQTSIYSFWDMVIKCYSLFSMYLLFMLLVTYLFVFCCTWFFLGKQVIHPNQIEAVQEEFAPSQERIKWATELIAAFEEHQNLGKVHIQ